MHRLHGVVACYVRSSRCHGSRLPAVALTSLCRRIASGRTGDATVDVSKTTDKGANFAQREVADDAQGAASHTAPCPGCFAAVTGPYDRSDVYRHTLLGADSQVAAGPSSPASATATTTSSPTSLSSSSRIPIILRPSSQSPPPPSMPPATTAAMNTAAHSDLTGETVTAARPQDGPMVPDYGPLRATGLWSVDEVVDTSRRTVDFRRIDEVESEVVAEQQNGGGLAADALVAYDEEAQWKYKLMFRHKFVKTPRHLTWKELGQEIECMDCDIEPDEHRPEELYTIRFYFTDKAHGLRDLVWTTRNDVAYSEGLTDLLAAVGACLGRSNVHRTIRFDDGLGSTRDLSIRKSSRYTSDITLAFRPAVSYHRFERKAEQDEYEAALEAEGFSPWGFHPALMDPEYNELDFHDPEGTYTVALSAHGFSFVVLRALKRLLARPMRDFYRPSQLMRTAKVVTEDDIGLSHAVKGWLGCEDQVYPHFTPMEALQEHWLGKDAPFTLCAMINKLREMTYLRPENPEFQSWLSVRRHDTHLAVRNLGVKMLGVGASTLFLPVAHDATVNSLLPKHQQRHLTSRISVNALLDMPDETRRLDEFRHLAANERLGVGATRPASPQSDGGTDASAAEGTEPDFKSSPPLARDGG